MAAGDECRRGGIVVGVVIAALRVIHTVVVGIGIVNGCANSLRIVNGTTDVDHHLRVRLDGQRVGEVPHTIPTGNEPLSLVGQLSVVSVVPVGGMTVGWRTETHAQIAQRHSLIAIVIEDKALVVLEEGDAIVLHASAIVEFLDDHLAGSGLSHLHADRGRHVLANGNLARCAIVDVIDVMSRQFFLRGGGFIDAGCDAESCRTLCVRLLNEDTVGLGVAQLHLEAGLAVGYA